MGLDPQKFGDAVDQAFGYVGSGEIPSALVCIANKTKILEIAACNETPEADPSLHGRIFALASITKAVTGVGVARLVDEGKLDYDDLVIKHIPEFDLDEGRRRITIGQILNHGTGLVGPAFPEYYKGPYPPEETYKFTFEGDLLFDPGAGMVYGTASYQLLAEIVRRLLNVRMSAFLAKYVLDPCGMVDTGFRPVDEERAMPVVDFPTKDPKKIERFRQIELAGGGLWSTAEDVVRFAQAVIEPGRLMNPKTYQSMMTFRRSVRWGKGTASCRSMGWVKEKQEHFPNQPETGFYHGGATGTLLWIDPERDFIFVFLTNIWSSCNDQAFATLDCFYRE